jgi:hypothetical protein
VVAQLAREVSHFGYWSKPWLSLAYAGAATDDELAELTADVQARLNAHS